MRCNHTHLRSKLFQSPQRGWARVLTAILILATTAANVGAIGLLHVCPVRGLAEMDDCCCPEIEIVEEAVSLECCDDSAFAASDRCACGTVLLVEDASGDAVTSGADFEFAPAALAVDSPWTTLPQELVFAPGPDRSRPRHRARPAYLLFSSWTC